MWYQMNEVSIVNIERIVEEVVVALTLIIQVGVKRSMLELTNKVMSELSSFMKDARQHLLMGHRDVNATKGDGALKKTHEGENVVTKKGEKCSKLNEKGAVDVNNPSTPLPDGQSCI
ncbi:unnamed protein product [Prunus brigantina]